MTKKPVLPAPAEQQAAIALLTRHEQINRDAATCDTLSDDRRAALDELVMLADAYDAAARDAWRRNVAEWYAPLEWGDVEPPAVVTGHLDLDRQLSRSTPQSRAPLRSRQQPAGDRQRAKRAGCILGSTFRTSKAIAENILNNTPATEGRAA